MKSKDYRLNGMKSAMCHVKITRFCDPKEDGSIIVELWSYYTKVVTIKANKKVGKYYVFDNVCEVRSRGYFSRSTMRHINCFTTEFLGENLYWYIKRICGKDCSDLVFVCMFDLDKEPNARKALARALETYHASGKHFTDYTKSEVERFNANAWRALI